MRLAVFFLQFLVCPFINFDISSATRSKYFPCGAHSIPQCWFVWFCCFFLRFLFLGTRDLRLRLRFVLVVKKHLCASTLTQNYLLKSAWSRLSIERVICVNTNFCLFWEFFFHSFICWLFAHLYGNAVAVGFAFCIIFCSLTSKSKMNSLFSLRHVENERSRGKKKEEEEEVAAASTNHANSLSFMFCTRCQRHNRRGDK